MQSSELWATPFVMNQVKAGALLTDINIPADLRKLKPEQLEEVCKELRQYIIDIVSVNGGHFGASLGVVEMTVALHYVFNTPYDQLVWDVGHQAYGHKVLTGRREFFHTNRIYKGISGFPKRSESEYDTFGAQLTGQHLKRFSSISTASLATNLYLRSPDTIFLISSLAMISTAM